MDYPHPMDEQGLRLCLIGQRLGGGVMYHPDRPELTNEEIYEGELAKLRAEQAVAEEHYRAAMAMSEKHRKNWVEACHEREGLITMLRIIQPVLEAMAEGKSCQIAAGDLSRRVRAFLKERDT